MKSTLVLVVTVLGIWAFPAFAQDNDLDKIIAVQQAMIKEQAEETVRLEAKVNELQEKLENTTLQSFRCFWHANANYAFVNYGKIDGKYCKSALSDVRTRCKGSLAHVSEIPAGWSSTGNCDPI